MARESCLSLILLVIFHLGNGKGYHHDFTLGMFPRAAMAVPVPRDTVAGLTERREALLVSCVE